VPGLSGALHRDLGRDAHEVEQVLIAAFRRFSASPAG
jgi:hypothetical protein